MEIMITAMLIFLTQTGFAMLETGFVRRRNATDVVMKALCIFSGTILMFCLLDHFLALVPDESFVLFSLLFCALTAKIAASAMAERAKILPCCLFGIFIGVIVFPLSEHWVWGAGWLQYLGFHDFAGGTAVHVLGGTAALLGAWLLGPRLGKYDRLGKPRVIKGHNVALSAIGVALLWFSWFGFSFGFVLWRADGAATHMLSDIFVHLSLASASSTMVALMLTWMRYKKPDATITLNGVLAGLVGITAGCDVVSASESVWIGMLAGVIAVLGIEWIDKRLNVDDPIGVVGVHALGGAVGTIALGLFARDGGLLHGGGFRLLGVQLLGVGVVIVWAGALSFLAYKLLDALLGFRITQEEELAEIELSVPSPPDGYTWAEYPFLTRLDWSESVQQGEVGYDQRIGVDQAVPTVDLRTSVAACKMTRIDIVTKPNRLDELKTAMNLLGITGMTVCTVMGYGMQRGATQFYRGVEIEATLLPKIKLEIVVCKVPVRAVVEAAKQTLYTGNIGDGKIFVYDVENVVKIRTGEEGYEALQDSDQDVHVFDDSK
jgi:Amt family ammonium transporter